MYPLFHIIKNCTGFVKLNRKGMRGGGRFIDKTHNCVIEYQENALLHLKQPDDTYIRVFCDHSA